VFGGDRGKRHEPGVVSLACVRCSRVAEPDENLVHAIGLATGRLLFRRRFFRFRSLLELFLFL